MISPVDRSKAVELIEEAVQSARLSHEKINK